MSVGGSGVFSVQAVLISLALHIVVVGGLYSFGTSGEKPSAVDAPVSKSEVTETETSPVEKTEAERPETPKPKPDAPEIKKIEIEPKPEKPKDETGGGSVQIRIEPRADDKPDGGVPVKNVETPERNGNPAPADGKAGDRTKVYVVKRGDTLTALARECGVSVQELAALNGKSVKKFSALWVGQKIKIPAAE
jgi:LysM repeat protein